MSFVQVLEFDTKQSKEVESLLSDLQYGPVGSGASQRDHTRRGRRGPVGHDIVHSRFTWAADPAVEVGPAHRGLTLIRP